jgi:pre-mRNA-processing factor SLU7
VVKGVDKAPTRTKYEEDVYVNNHTSVWGSYYR